MEKETPSTQAPPPFYNQPYFPPEEDEIDLYELWLVLIKRKKILLGTILICFILSLIIAFAIPPTYRAQFTILPSRNKVIDPTSILALKMFLGNDFNIFLSTITTNVPNPEGFTLAILKSKELRKLIAEELNITNEPDEFLKKAISVEKNRREKVIMVKVDTHDPSLSLKIAKSCLNYLKLLVNKKTNQSIQTKLNYLIEKYGIQDKEQIKALKALLENPIIIYVIDNPYVIKKPVKPKKKLIISVAIVSGLFLGIFLCFFLEWLEKAKKQREN